MGTENQEQKDPRANNREQNRDSLADENSNAKRDPAGNPLDDQELVGGMSKDSPTNDQPSASQNNKWEQENNVDAKPIAGQQGSDGYEDNSRPARQYSSSEDDELEAEQTKNYRTDEYVEDNDLERNDQDYRDGDNHSGEDQDEEDALRNGK